MTEPTFLNWEQEKKWKIEQLSKIGESVQEMGSFLSQFGMQGNTVHGKINAIVDMLLECGVITEKQLLNMEYKFAKETEAEMKEACAEIRKQAAITGQKLPNQKQSGIIIPGR